MAVSATDLQKLYLAYFGRPADPAGITFYLNSSMDIWAVAAAFSASPESQTLYGSGFNSSVINNIYNNLFNRDAEPAGLLYWTQEVAAGRLTAAGAAFGILVGAQNSDATTVANKLAVSAQFTAHLDTTAEILAYAGDAAAAAARTFLKTVTSDPATVTTATGNVDSTITNIVTVGGQPGQVYTLTSAIDTIAGTGGNDTINGGLTSGGADTFTSLDNIDGGSGNDTFNLVTTGSLATAAGATVKNVETANVTSANPITAADVSSWSGLKTVNVASSGAIAGVKAAATTDINVGAGLAAVTVNGGNNVTVKSSGGNIDIGSTKAAAGNVTATNTFSTGTITMDGAGALTATAKKGAIVFTDGTSVKATASSAVSEADVAAHLATQASATAANTKATGDTDASGLAKTAAMQAVTDLATLATAIAAATNYSADQTTALSIELATTTAVNAGAITTAQKVAIDAAFIAGLNTSVAAARTAAQAVLTPIQTAAATASTAAQSADAVHDAQVAAALADANAAVAADATAATNVAAVTVTATTNTALASASVTGNYGSTNTITDGSTLQNTLTTVTLNNAGNTTVTGLAVANVSATAMHGNVTVTNSTAAHTQNFTLTDISAGTYQDNVATTINIVSSGTVGNTLTGMNGTAATAVNVGGGGDIDFGGAANFAAAAVIDATGASGMVAINVAAGQTYKGGAGADVVTMNNGVVQAKDVDGGAGTSDKLVLKNATDYGTTGAAHFKNFEVLSLASGLSADLSTFTGSSFTSEILNGGTSSLTSLNATQAGHITVTANGTYTIGVTGATTVGQLDTVGITVSDGLSAKNDITLTSPVLAGVETVNLVATDNIIITDLLNATAFTNINATGAGKVTITSGALALNVNSVVDASAVTGKVTLDFSAATANGISLKGGSGNNVLTGTNIAGKGNSITSGDGNNTVTGGQADDVITLGNGNNTVHGAAGSNTITVGNGNNTIDVVGSANANTITAGNGYNVITGGSAADKIVVGTGGNLVTGGAGGDKITFGAHAAGVVDGVVLTATGDTLVAASAAAAATAAGTSLAGADVVTGMQSGDTINVNAFNATGAGTLATTIAGAGTSTAGSLVVGTYDATTKIFTASSTGTDSLLVVDADGTAGGNLELVVLVGFHGTASLAGGVITLV